MQQALLYMHGFRSSPGSMKAAVFKDCCLAAGIRFCAPDLNLAPLAACRRLEESYEKLSRECSEVMLAGSSLGGFYCAWLAARTGARAALINPAVHPWDVVGRYLGEQTIYGTDRTICVSPAYEGELYALRTPVLPEPERVLLFLTTGDEVLDWHEAAALYGSSPSIVVDGGDHAVSNFAEHVPAVMNFLFAGGTH